VDEEFSGAALPGLGSGVQSTLDGILEQLTLKPHLKFGLSNVKLFAMWYTRQTKEVQD
jgi:hypothetical protein